MLKQYTYSKLTKSDINKLCIRADASYESIMPEVKATMQKVAVDGDYAITSRYRQLFGQAFTNIAVSRQEIVEAYKQVPSEFVDAIRQMIKTCTVVQVAQLPQFIEKKVQSEKGVYVWREWRAIKRVGLYIPGGSALYPSTVVMNAVPAIVAGCSDIVVTTRPTNTGVVDPSILVACDLLGISQIYKVGGPMAIAALAYGTESIAKVDKIVGPGNRFVTCAKLAVYGLVDIDVPAGPSEVMIIADKSASPTYIASDLIADAEHSGDNGCVLVSTSTTLISKVNNVIQSLVPTISTAPKIVTSFRDYGFALKVNDINEAIEFANIYAPEHLSIMTQSPLCVASQIDNAGSVFIGNFTSKSAGDYATGANHVLPTGSSARMFGPLGVADFGKWIEFQKCTRGGLAKLRKTIKTISEIEKLPGHTLATEIRFK